MNEDISLYFIVYILSSVSRGNVYVCKRVGVGWITWLNNSLSNSLEGFTLEIWCGNLRFNSELFIARNGSVVDDRDIKSIIRI